MKTRDLLFLLFRTETILRTDEGQPRRKYFFNKMWNQHPPYLLFRARFGSSTSPNLKTKGVYEVAKVS